MMELFQELLILYASVSKLEPDEEKSSSEIRYITNGRNYKQRVRRANKLKFTYLPLNDFRGQPRPMNILEQFLNGGWRLRGWEAYALSAKAKAGQSEKSSGVKKTPIIRRITLAFFGAVIIDLLLSFIIWILIMMGISQFNWESKFLTELDPLNLFIWIWLILFGLFFLGFLGFIKTK